MALSGVGFTLKQVRGHTIVPDGLNDNSFVIDAGAHRGEFSSELITDYGCVCCLVEPNPALTPVTDVGSGVTVIRGALAAKDGKVSFFPSDNPEAGSIIMADDSGGAGCQIDVDAVSLVTLIDRHMPGRIDLLKLDIEGAEFEVLLETPGPVLTTIGQITVEFHDFRFPRHFKGAYGTVRRRLESLGFLPVRRSIRTHGDILFLNRRFFEIGIFRAIYLKHVYRWAARFRQHENNLTKKAPPCGS